MDTETTSQLMLDALYGDLSPEQEYEFRKSMAQHDELAEEYSEQQWILQSYRLAEKPQPPSAAEVTRQIMLIMSSNAATNSLEQNNDISEAPLYTQMNNDVTEIVIEEQPKFNLSWLWHPATVVAGLFIAFAGFGWWWINQMRGSVYKTPGAVTSEIEERDAISRQLADSDFDQTNLKDNHWSKLDQSVSPPLKSDLEVVDQDNLISRDSIVTDTTADKSRLNSVAAAKTEEITGGTEYKHGSPPSFLSLPPRETKVDHAQVLRDSTRAESPAVDQIMALSEQTQDENNTASTQLESVQPRQQIRRVQDEIIARTAKQSEASKLKAEELLKDKVDLSMQVGSINRKAKTEQSQPENELGKTVAAVTPPIATALSGSTVESTTSVSDSVLAAATPSLPASSTLDTVQPVVPHASVSPSTVSPPATNNFTTPTMASASESALPDAPPAPLALDAANPVATIPSASVPPPVTNNFTAPTIASASESALPAAAPATDNFVTKPDISAIEPLFATKSPPPTNALTQPGIAVNSRPVGSDVSVNAREPSTTVTVASSLGINSSKVDSPSQPNQIDTPEPMLLLGEDHLPLPSVTAYVPPQSDIAPTTVTVATEEPDNSINLPVSGINLDLLREEPAKPPAFVLGETMSSPNMPQVATEIGKSDSKSEITDVLVASSLPPTDLVATAPLLPYNLPKPVPVTPAPVVRVGEAAVTSPDESGRIVRRVRTEADSITPDATPPQPRQTTFSPESVIAATASGTESQVASVNNEPVIRQDRRIGNDNRDNRSSRRRSQTPEQIAHEMGDRVVDLLTQAEKALLSQQPEVALPLAREAALIARTRQQEIVALSFLARAQMDLRQLDQAENTLQRLKRAEELAKTEGR